MRTIDGNAVMQDIAHCGAKMDGGEDKEHGAQ